MGSNGTGSTSFYSVAVVSVPDCVDSGTQTDISFQNIVTVRSRGGHHLLRHGRSPSPPPPHLLASNGMDGLYVPPCPPCLR